MRITTKQAAKLADVTEETIRNWCNSGRLPHIRRNVGRAVYIIESQELSKVMGYDVIEEKKNESD